jgi:hypothetical protein
MGIIAAVRGLASFDGVSRLPRAAVAALKPLDFHVYLGQRTEMPDAPPGVRLYADALDRLREHRKGREDLPNEFWRDEINGARYCAIAEKDGQLAAVIWLYAYPARRPMLVLAPGDAEISAAYILPAFRGCNLYRPLGFLLRRWWLDSHGGRIFAVAASDSPATLAVLQRNYQHVATLRRNSLFGARFHTARVPHRHGQASPTLAACGPSTARPVPVVPRF